MTFFLLLTKNLLLVLGVIAAIVGWMWLMTQHPVLGLGAIVVFFVLALTAMEMDN